MVDDWIVSRRAFRVPLDVWSNRNFETTLKCAGVKSHLFVTSSIWPTISSRSWILSRPPLCPVPVSSRKYSRSWSSRQKPSTLSAVKFTTPWWPVSFCSDSLHRLFSIRSSLTCAKREGARKSWPGRSHWSPKRCRVSGTVWVMKRTRYDLPWSSFLVRKESPAFSIFIVRSID